MTIDEYQDDLVVYRKDITRVFQLQHPNAVSAAIAIRNLYPGRVQLSLTPINDDQILAITGQTSLQLDPETEVRDLGNTLLIQPKINADRTVTLTIIQESSSRSTAPSTIPVIVNNTTQEVRLILLIPASCRPLLLPEAT